MRFRLGSSGGMEDPDRLVVSDLLLIVLLLDWKYLTNYLFLRHLLRLNGLSGKVLIRSARRIKCDFVPPVSSERGSAQNRKAGKDPGAFTSVETLISRQRSASAGVDTRARGE